MAENSVKSQHLPGLNHRFGTIAGEDIMNAPEKLTVSQDLEVAAPDIHALFARFPRGPMADMVGWHCVGFADGELTLNFTPKPFFCNPMGMIHGGFVASMLDESMGSAILAVTSGKNIGATISASIDFIRPAMLGTLATTSRVRNLGKSIAFVEAELWSSDGKLLAKAAASFKLVALGF
jgi:uncharacterized protein (TIGR00369 family)